MGKKGGTASALGCPPVIHARQKPQRRRNLSRLSGKAHLAVGMPRVFLLCAAKAGKFPSAAPDSMWAARAAIFVWSTQELTVLDTLPD